MVDLSFVSSVQDFSFRHLLFPQLLFDYRNPEIRINTAFLMDLAGVEPASESPFIKTSSITVINLTFPPCNA